MKYGIVLKEKTFVSGLTRNEVIVLFDSLDNTEAYPLELEARNSESTAMGFITSESAEVLDYDYETSGLRDFIATILDNMDNESPDCVYEFKGIRIWLSR